LIQNKLSVADDHAQLHTVYVNTDRINDR